MNGRRIIVTGGGAGIGRSTAQMLAAEGAKVAVLDQNLEAAEANASAFGGVALHTDVADEASVEAAISRAAAALGGLDGVVNAAGIALIGPLETTTTDVWNRVIRINLTGTFLVCRAALKWLCEAELATIVNVASAQALLPGPNTSAYAASKGGVVTLSKSLAAELAPRIRVNVVCPGTVATPMTSTLFDAAQMEAARLNYAMKRIATPDEIASAVVFLSGPGAAMVTGVALAADGGRSFH